MLLGTEFCSGATAARRGPVRIPVRARGGQRDLGQGCRRTALRVQTEEWPMDEDFDSSDLTASEELASVSFPVPASGLSWCQTIPRDASHEIFPGLVFSPRATTTSQWSFLLPPGCSCACVVTGSRIGSDARGLRHECTAVCACNHVDEAGVPDGAGARICGSRERQNSWAGKDPTACSSWVGGSSLPRVPKCEVQQLGGTGDGKEGLLGSECPPTRQPKAGGSARAGCAAGGLGLSQPSPCLAEGLRSRSWTTLSGISWGATVGGARAAYLSCSVRVGASAVPASKSRSASRTAEELSVGAAAVLRSLSLRRSDFEPILRAGEPVTTLGRTCPSSGPSSRLRSVAATAKLLQQCLPGGSATGEVVCGGLGPVCATQTSDRG
ncbi:uncharacterized protein LOC142365353 [Opisthocomus hoazin]|uniref:uncharacterized protein LOC142365353 n=1 Tax=Opisthocomus hoazin TaxID=30419 RepID=UPI003F53C948